MFLTSSWKWGCCGFGATREEWGVGLGGSSVLHRTGGPLKTALQAHFPPSASLPSLWAGRVLEPPAFHRAPAWGWWLTSVGFRPLQCEGSELDLGGPCPPMEKMIYA